MTFGKVTYLWRLALLGLAALTYQNLPCVNEFVNRGITYLKYRDFEGLRIFILSYGVWAPITSISLMALQSMVPLVPGLAITITIAWIFGWQWGALYSWLGALLGATLDFCLARWYGRPLVEKIIRPQQLDSFDAFFLKHGIIAVLITRLTPIVPFKVVSYGAGLTTIALCQFVLATGIGQTPAIILYSILGQNLVKNLFATVMITILLVVAGLTAYRYRDTLENLFCNKDSS
ncbi:alkaline phosphatase [Anaerosporomusa subterranea]|uniref:TVP38/TMEM64 family membrane protein n=1 Tax=Anaerosporomusa subterranea TaxID=1794912 RepID=A0A154BTJ7_ANASB|nr:TVP38/TMEM64 family protein [Anaerosporomusa subterranea]KYZ77227.1 alkaline phosphatase [Anaerosporomusa subterranea]